MKKYMTFIISFILLFSLFTFSAEIISGVFLTVAYTPNINEAWNTSATLSNQITLTSNQSPFLFTLGLALLASTASYWIAQKTSKQLKVD